MTIEQLAADLKLRMDQMDTKLDESISDDKLKSRIQEVLGALSDDDPVVRKLIRGKESMPNLVGSKFARWEYGLEDVEFLYDILNAGVAGQRTKKGLSDDLKNAFTDLSAAVYVPEEQLRQWDKRALDDEFPRIPKRGLIPKYGFDQRTWNQMYQRASMAAMDTAESGYGSQLIGATYMRDMWMGARAESRIFSLFDTFEMQDSTVYMPVEADIPEMIFVGENTTFEPDGANEYAVTKTGSQRVQVDAKKFIINQVWSGELEEDAIIPWIPYLRRQAQLSLAHYSDSVLLNGDNTNAATGNINLDDADPADTKHYLAVDGVRHAALVDNTANKVSIGAPPSLNNIFGLKALMIDQTRLMDWGHPTDAADLVFITDPYTADRLLMIDEVLEARLRNGGTDLFNGEVSRILGHPIINSMAMGLTEADGKLSTTPGNNTLGQIAAMNRRAFKVGWKRRVKIEAERFPGRDQNRLIYSLRFGFGRFTPTGNVNAIEGAAVAYNITV